MMKMMKTLHRRGTKTPETNENHNAKSMRKTCGVSTSETHENEGYR